MHRQQQRSSWCAHMGVAADRRGRERILSIATGTLRVMEYCSSSFTRMMPTCVRHSSSHDAPRELQKHVTTLLVCDAHVLLHPGVNCSSRTFIAAWESQGSHSWYCTQGTVLQQHAQHLSAVPPPHPHTRHSAKQTHQVAAVPRAVDGNARVARFQHRPQRALPQHVVGGQHEDC